MSKYFLFFTILLVNTSCYKNSSLEGIDETTDKYPGVDKSLWTYFNHFEEEANNRGLAIDLSSSGISATFADLPDDHVAGLCSYNYLDPGHITIDIPFWTNASPLQRELILFHELGHCFLYRDHLDSAFSNGLCRSIMRSGTCCCQDAYTEANRTYYLDELFEVWHSM